MQELAIEGYCLSPQQEYVWLLQGGDRSGVFRALCVISIEGDLDRGAFISALREVVSSNEILRTTFPAFQLVSEPLQVITDGGEAPIRERDLSRLSVSERRRSVEATLNEIKQGEYDCGRGPLIDLRLLKLSHTRRLLIADMAALCADAGTMRAFARDLTRRYEAITTGGEAPDGPMQYADIAQWQNSILDDENDGIGKRFWGGLDFSGIAKQKLVFEKDAGAGDFRPRTAGAVLDAETIERLGQVAGKCDGSLSDILLACWQVLLWRLTGQSETTVAAAFDLRKYGELEEALGPLTTYLPVRAPLSASARFEDFAKTASQASAEARRYQEFFDWRLAPQPPEPGSALFFPFGFEFVDHCIAMQEDCARPVRFSIQEEYLCLNRFKLKLSCIKKAGLLSADLYYDAGLFSEEDARRLLDGYRRLLRSVIENPRAAICDLDVLGDDERRQALVEFNRTGREFAVGCIHELFEAQAVRAPESVAVVFDQQSLSYKELNSRANQMACRLRKLNVGPDTLVGICVDRSPEMIVALLGILKAGGAYLPLDPSYPNERLAFMLKDSGAGVLIRQRRFAEDLAALCERVITIDGDVIFASEDGDEKAGARVSADNLAYAIYTSGSTGNPKGVMISHRAICNRLLWMQDVYPLEAADRVLQKTPLSFDASVWELFVPLLAGAQLVLALPGEHKNAGYLAREIAEKQVTVLQLVPSMLQVFVEEPAAPACRSLKRVFSGGEALPGTLQSRFFQSLPSASLQNLYGPTENSIDATAWSCDLEASHGIVPIGRPISNVRIYLLDQQWRPVPIGATGQLHIGGAGLARGYLNRPELTAEKFIPDPFQGDPGTRLYETGDLARFMPDGRIEFIGRADNQVKIRGFRIELGEIETALRLHSAVREAAVVVNGGAEGDKHLVAYLVAGSEPRPKASEIKEFLKSKLPDHMVPSAIAMMETMPYTPSGKLDRKALPPLDRVGVDSDKNFAPLRTLTEERLAAIWKELLAIDRLGAHDNFFDLGGHSLLATQLISRVRESFQVEAPLRTMFEAPTIADLARRIELIRKSSEGGKSNSPPVIPVSRDQSLPTSFAQQRLWFLEQLEGESAAYNIATAVQLAGPLDLGAVEESLREIVRRHESLRTTFDLHDGRPVQIIAPTLEVEAPLIDLHDMGHADVAQAARQFAKEEAEGTFDLKTGPLLRVTVLRLNVETHLMLLTMHHIISDGWSMGVFVREMAALYDAFSKKSPSPLPELPVQYADYAVWQREWLQGEALESQLAYWKKKLLGAPDLLELPTDRPRPAVQTFKGANTSFSLDERIARRLKGLSREQDATLFMTLLAAFDTLLYRYSGHADVVVGSPIAGRNKLETENLIGLFINTLVLRADLSGSPTFREVIARVRETVLEASVHQDLPFEKLVEELKPERSLSHSPLFQVMFTLQNAPPQILSLPGLTFSPIEIGGETAKFDLTFALYETGPNIAGSLEYNTDLFDEGTIRRMLANFTTLLDNIVADPNRPITELPILSGAERRQLLVDWNQTEAACQGEFCLHTLFEAQADRTPEKAALVFGSETVSYGELNRRANKLAHYLRSLGVGPETRVAVCIDRSVEMAVGLLGILKAGAAYLPIDPAYPQARRAFVLADSDATVALTQSSLSDTLNPYRGTVVQIDSSWASVSSGPVESADNPAFDVTAGNLAYVIYTSGSTGKPKGAQITHGSVVNFLRSMAHRPGMSSDDVLFAITSLSFDIAGLELWLPLTLGAKLVLASRDEAGDPARIIANLDEHQVTVMQGTPSTWKMLLGAGWKPGGGLRILCGGEALPPELASALLNHDECVWNLYGPTETTIWSALDRVESADDVSIGGPIRNTQLYLLDRNFNPVPIGAAGELYIGGDGVARGYLDRPRLTAERFVPDPFAGKPGARIYRTGDLARYLPNGNVDFLGRVDNQVKVRGFRIELGEIEAALASHPATDRVVVVAREDAPGERRLVAYVVPSGNLVPSAGELRAFIKTKLPDYMSPAQYVFLERMPLTPNGKIDRKALPAPGSQTVGLEDGPQRLRKPTEEILDGIWSEVLKIDRIGLGDNFFELGGHSLLATQVVSRIRETLGVEMPVRKIFEAPTIAGLAESIEASSFPAAGLHSIPVNKVSRNSDLPLSFAQRRLWFFDQLDPGSSTFNLPAAVRLKGGLNIQAFCQALNEVVRRHESLRTSFHTIRGEAHQVIAPEQSIQPAFIDLSHSGERRESEAARIIRQKASAPFDLSQSPLTRVAILRLREDDHIVAFVMHHIISDGWSIGVLVREIVALYQAFVDGSQSRLPAIEIQCADYAAWQRDLLQGDVLEAHLEYWRTRLAGAPAVTELPTDAPRPSVRTYRGAMSAVALPRGLSEGVRALSKREGVTTFMSLLAGYQILLRGLTGQDDIVVGTDVANRNRKEIEGLIGFFVNQLALRADLSGDPSFSDLLGRVREMTLGAYAHQDLPFEQLVETLRPERSLKHPPLFQVKFVLQNTPIDEVELSGLTFSPAPLDWVSAKFDLTLLLTEEKDGISGYFEYNSDLFKPETIERLEKQYESILQKAVTSPEMRLSEFDEDIRRGFKEWSVDEPKRQEAKLKRLGSLKPKPLNVRKERLVKLDYLRDGSSMPLVIRPAIEDLDLLEWAPNNLQFIESELLRHGAILFRGFDISSPERFESFAKSFCPDLFNENGEHPRQAVSGNIYTPVFYPPDQRLLWHNENSFNHRWPTRIWFCCATPPRQGGETPIVDSRRVFQAIDPKIAAVFLNRGVMYVRNYSKELGLDWETVFQTGDKELVELRCRENGMDFEWREGNSLITRSARPAAVRHPKTGQMTWFNQAQHWHISCLDPATRRSMRALFRQEDYPRNCYYGDGAPIEDSVMESILEAYARLEVSYRWEKGDILMLDNLLIAHGRNPFEGDRKLLVAMGDMLSYDQVATSAD